MNERQVRISLMEADAKLGYCNEDMTWKTAECMGLSTTGVWVPCESCAIAKAKQKNVPKVSEHVKATADATPVGCFLIFRQLYLKNMGLRLPNQTSAYLSTKGHK